MDLQEALIAFAETFDRRMVELLPFIENGKSPIGHVATPRARSLFHPQKSVLLIQTPMHKHGKDLGQAELGHLPILGLLCPWIAVCSVIVRLLTHSD